MIVNSGTTATGALYSFGPTGLPSPERALGSIGSNTVGDQLTSIVIQNKTGTKITSFSFRYTGEQWRNGGNANKQQLVVDWIVSSAFSSTLLDASNVAGFTAVPAADFESPIATLTGAPLDGNLSANRVTGLGASSVAVSLLPNEYLVIRWWDNNDAGNDHALAIDDFEFSAVTEAVPEPFTMALGAAGLAVAVIRRRRAANR